MAKKITVLSFGLGGFTGYFPTERYPSGSTCKETLQGYDTDPERTVTDLASSPRRKATNSTYDVEGAVIIDKRPAVEGKNGVSVSLKSPMLDLALQGPEAFDAVGAASGILGNALLSQPGNVYGGLLAGAMLGQVNLGSCGVRDYVAYWRGHGARIGIVRDGAIVWD